MNSLSRSLFPTVSLKHCNDARPSGLRVLSLMGKFIKVGPVSLRIQVNCVCLQMHTLSTSIVPSKAQRSWRGTCQDYRKLYIHYNSVQQSTASHHSGAQKERKRDRDTGLIFQERLPCHHSWLGVCSDTGECHSLWTLAQALGTLDTSPMCLKHIVSHLVPIFCPCLV